MHSELIYLGVHQDGAGCFVGFCSYGFHCLSGYHTTLKKLFRQNYCSQILHRVLENSLASFLKRKRHLLNAYHVPVLENIKMTEVEL